MADQRLDDKTLGRVLSRYFQDRDRRGVRDFRLTKPELRAAILVIVAGLDVSDVMRAAKPDEHAALARVYGEVVAEIERERVNASRLPRTAAATTREGA